MDFLADDAHRTDSRALNPAAQVPVVRFANGRVLAQSNAIITYLAADGPLVPCDAFDHAAMLQWMFWEQYSHEPAIAVCRFLMVYKGGAAGERVPGLVTGGDAVPDQMERHLSAHPWFDETEPSLADLALLPYNRLAPEGGFDLGPRPAVRTWISRAETAFSVALEAQPLQAVSAKAGRALQRADNSANAWYLPPVTRSWHKGR